jgi:hypothetical protein
VDPAAPVVVPVAPPAPLVTLVLALELAALLELVVAPLELEPVVVASPLVVPPPLVVAGRFGLPSSPAQPERMAPTAK